MWYYQRHREAHGPFTDEEIRGLIRSLTIHGTTLVRKDGQSQWDQASETQFATDIENARPGNRAKPKAAPLQYHSPRPRIRAPDACFVLLLLALAVFAYVIVLEAMHVASLPSPRGDPAATLRIYRPDPITAAQRAGSWLAVWLALGLWCVAACKACLKVVEAVILPNPREAWFRMLVPPWCVLGPPQLLSALYRVAVDPLRWRGQHVAAWKFIWDILWVATLTVWVTFALRIIPGPHPGFRAANSLFWLTSFTHLLFVGATLLLASIIQYHLHRPPEQPPVDESGVPSIPAKTVLPKPDISRRLKHRRE